MLKRGHTVRHLATSEWTLRGKLISADEGRQRVLQRALSDIAFMEDLQIADLELVPYQRADSFGAAAIIGEVVMFRPAVPVAEHDEPHLWHVVAGVVPGYLAIRYGVNERACYVARLVLDPSEPDPEGSAVISTAYRELLL